MPLLTRSISCSRSGRGQRIRKGHARIPSASDRAQARRCVESAPCDGECGDRPGGLCAVFVDVGDDWHTAAGCLCRRKRRPRCVGSTAPARGKAGLSVNWGALRGGGMADSSPEVRRYLEVLGQRDILVGHLPALLQRLWPSTDKLSNVVIANMDWRRLLLGGRPPLKSSTRFAEFAAALGDSALHFRTELFALPADQRLEVLTSMLAEQVAAVLGIPPTPLIITHPWRSSVSIRCRRSSLLHAWRRRWTFEYRRWNSSGSLDCLQSRSRP